jgi:epoxyqueuosine reductase QueG
MISKKEIERIVGSCGICSFEKIKDHLIDCRKKAEIPQNAKSVILFTFPYKVKEEKPLNISRYAAVLDYHTLAAEILNKYCQKLKETYKNNAFVSFADNSPVPEVYASVKAGLGVLGKNGLLITKEYGSFVFIGEIVTDLKIESDSNEFKNCIGCKKCIDACPSKAISETGLNRNSCLSEVTQRKGELSDAEKALMKECGCVWGCDICQDICPMNKNAAETKIEEFLSSAKPNVSLGCELTDRAYEWRGRKVIERNISIFNK